MRSFRLQQCFNQFLIFSVEGSSKTRLFRHLSNDVFWSPWLRKYISYEGHPFFGKCVKIDIDLKNAKKKQKKKNWERVFSSAVIALTNSHTILHITKRDFLKMQLPSQWLIYMVKRLSFRLQQCLNPFAMLFIEGSSERWPFKNLCDNVFRSP